LKLTITRILSFLLVTFSLLNLLSLAICYGLLQSASRNRDLASAVAELRARTSRVHWILNRPRLEIGDFAYLKRFVSDTRTTLEALAHGGVAFGHHVPSIYPELSGELKVAEQKWDVLEPALSALSALAKPEEAEAPPDSRLHPQINQFEIQIVRLVTLLEGTRDLLRKRMFQMIAWLSAASGFLLLICVIVLNKRVIRPIQLLVSGTRAIQSGDFSHRVPVLFEHELGALSSSFNQMADTIQQHVERLNRAVDRSVQAENQLRNSQELLDVALKNVPLTLYTADRELRYTWFHGPETARWHGLLSSGRQDQPLKQELPTALVEMKQQVLDTGAGARGEIHVGIGSHSEEAYDVTVEPLRLPSGEMGGVAVAALDITARANAARALTESEARYRRIFETVGVSLWEEDYSQVKALIDELRAQGVSDIRSHLAEHPELVETGIKLVRIKDVNPATLRMFGASDKGEILSSLQKIFIPESSSAFAEEMMMIFEGREYLESEAAVQTFDGRRLQVVFTIRFSKEDPRLENVLVSLTDITDREHAEQALRTTQAHLLKLNANLMRANEDLNQFAWSASHDLREPLRQVALYAEFLRKKYIGALSPQADTFISFMVEGAKRMDLLLNDLLQYMQIAETPEESPVGTDANLALEEALMLLRSFIQEAQAVVTRDTLPVVKMRHVHLVQLFRNLIENAIKYRSLEQPLIHIQSEPLGQECVVSVADNGIGIPQEYATRIFGIFKRLHTTAAYPGTGIGLAICQKIVERYGGRIWVEPNQGYGSVFRFTARV
jgi:PAS domain S-box-containing protein